MDKINMFFIIAFESQTYKYETKLNTILRDHERGIKRHSTALENHLLMLSKHFNLYNFFRHKGVIDKYDNTVIYHIPFGLDIQTGVEDELLLFKGRIPIVMRSYDPHSPLKTSLKYMQDYHDLTVTYLNERVNGVDVFFGNCCYDSHLIGVFNDLELRKRNICMILRNREGRGYNTEQDNFLKEGINLKKIYSERIEIVKNTKVDIYGSGWPSSMINWKGVLMPFDQKYSKLLQYKFNLILENAIVDTYISEKILDSFLTLSVPIYLGSPKISNQIDYRCYIDLSNYETYNNAIEALLAQPDGSYLEYQKQILTRRDRIFENFSTWENFSSTVYNWYNQKYGTSLGLNLNELQSINDALKDLRLVRSNNLFSGMRRVLNILKLKLGFK